MSSIKLNIGSGSSRFEGYMNVDHDNLCSPEYVLDIGKDTWPWPDSAVSAVKANHVLEHLGDPDFFHCLKELYRVCENGAIVEVEVPHHRHDTFINDPTHKRPITIDGMNLFSKEYNRLCEAQGDGSSKLGYYFDIDFKMIGYKFNIDPAYYPLLQNIKPGSKEEQEFQMALRERNNMVVTVNFTWEVVK